MGCNCHKRGQILSAAAKRIATGQKPALAQTVRALKTTVVRDLRALSSKKPVRFR